VLLNTDSHYILAKTSTRLKSKKEKTKIMAIDKENIYRGIEITVGNIK